MKSLKPRTLVAGLAVMVALTVVFDATQATAQVVVPVTTYYAPAQPVVTYRPHRAGLLGLRTVYRPEVSYLASPVAVAAPVVAAPVVAAPVATTTLYAPATTVVAPTTTYYAPATTVVTPAPTVTSYAPAVTTYYAPAAPTTVVTTPAPVTTYYAPSSPAPYYDYVPGY